MDRRWLHERGNVPPNLSALHRDLQGPRNDPVNLENARRRKAVGRELRVQGFQMLGLQPVQSMTTDIGHDPIADVTAVRGQRARPQSQTSSSSHKISVETHAAVTW